MTEFGSATFLTRSIMQSDSCEGAIEIAGEAATLSLLKFLILNRISKGSCVTYCKGARIGSKLVVGFRPGLRVFDGNLYNEFSTTNILLGPGDLCSHVVFVERRHFEVHAFSQSRSPLVSYSELYHARTEYGRAVLSIMVALPQE